MFPPILLQYTYVTVKKYKSRLCNQNTIPIIQVVNTNNLNAVEKCHRASEYILLCYQINMDLPHLCSFFLKILTAVSSSPLFSITSPFLRHSIPSFLFRKEQAFQGHHPNTAPQATRRPGTYSHIKAGGGDSVGRKGPKGRQESETLIRSLQSHY